MNYYIAFWNVESLFDVADSPNRTDKLKRALISELKGWNVSVLDKKLEQLSKIILKMNNNSGPDILGLAEVENRFVLELLVEKMQNPGRKYKMVHTDSSSERGIDTAFIYDANKVSANEMFSHFIQKNSSTRDVFQVNFRTNTGTLLVIINNHWPSRKSGQLRTEPFRMLAGETLAYFHTRVHEIHGHDVAVLAMGDFNDEPFNRSLTEYAGSENNRRKVTRTGKARFLNLMWQQLGRGIGSYFEGNEPRVFDQFLASKGLITGKSALKIVLNSVDILQFPEMVQVPGNRSPVRFGKGSAINKKGFSDHFPIALVLKDLSS